VNRLVALTLVLAVMLPGCVFVERQTPPNWDYFDVVQYPGGAAPATIGYYAGAATWFAPGLMLGAFPPEPVGPFLDLGIGHGIGTVLGVAVGAPFHLVSLPFRWIEGEPDPVPTLEEYPGPPEPDR
jgi:hypothetical protein